MTFNKVLEWGNQDFTDGCKTCLIPLTRQSERSPYTFEDEDDIEILPMAASKVSLREALGIDPRLFCEVK